MKKYHQQKLAEREVDDVSWQQVWRLQPQKRAGHQEKRQTDHTLPLLPERPGKTDWHLEKTLMTLFNKRWASSREGQCCSRMSDTVFVKTRWRSWPRSENGLDLGDMGNYWQKHLWLTRCLREAYAVLTRMLGNNFAKYSLNIPNVSSRKCLSLFASALFWYELDS